MAFVPLGWFMHNFKHRYGVARSLCIAYFALIVTWMVVHGAAMYFNSRYRYKKKVVDYAVRDLQKLYFLLLFPYLQLCICAIALNVKTTYTEYKKFTIAFTVSLVVFVLVTGLVSYFLLWKYLVYSESEGLISQKNNVYSKLLDPRYTAPNKIDDKEIAILATFPVNIKESNVPFDTLDNLSRTLDSPKIFFAAEDTTSLSESVKKTCFEKKDSRFYSNIDQANKQIHDEGYDIVIQMEMSEVNKQISYLHIYEVVAEKTNLPENWYKLCANQKYYYDWQNLEPGKKRLGFKTSFVWNDMNNQLKIPVDKSGFTPISSAGGGLYIYNNKNKKNGKTYVDHRLLNSGKHVKNKFTYHNAVNLYFPP
jgi:hypothetical protein